jgi:histidyl-tRNA synthetase
MKPKAQWGKVEQVREGKSHRYYLRPDGTAVAYTICCDCGLTHLEEFKPEKRYIRVKVWREEELTQKQRNRKKVKLVQK